MRSVTDRDVLEYDVAVVGRPPCWRIHIAGGFLLEVKKLYDTFNRDEIHLHLAIALAESVGIVYDCSDRQSQSSRITDEVDASYSQRRREVQMQSSLAIRRCRERGVSTGR